MECNIYKTVQKINFSVKKITEVVLYTLKREKVRGNISIHLIGDKRMRSLNRTYRGKDKTTDVLSFSSLEGLDMIMGEELGDIFISVPQIKRQAKLWDVTYKEEFMRMLIHGVLHILGHDHIIEREAKVMFGKQETYLKKFL